VGVSVEIGCENPVMIFQINKRINNELFADRTAAPYKRETQRIHSAKMPSLLKKT